MEPTQTAFEEVNARRKKGGKAQGISETGENTNTQRGKRTEEKTLGKNQRGQPRSRKTRREAQHRHQKGESGRTKSRGLR